MGNSKEWREKQKLSDQELSIITKNINNNMKKYGEDITARMEHSDRIELDMNKKARRPKVDNIRQKLIK